MTCVEVLAVLSDFVDGQLDAGVRDRVVEHLRGCDWCETFGGRFSSIVVALRRDLHNAAPLSRELLARLRARLEEDGSV
ncbi:MAG TPA: zf-HC2 domain-containing protein [Thermoanaerobaculia bacterium]|nr:zf-HC2 domain-containing protein [Thermoanaerobaculia bacterium]